MGCCSKRTTNRTEDAPHPNFVKFPPRTAVRLSCRFHVKTFGYRSGRHDKGSSHSYLRTTRSTHAQTHNPVRQLAPNRFVRCLLVGWFRSFSLTFFEDRSCAGLDVRVGGIAVGCCSNRTANRTEDAAHPNFIKFPPRTAVRLSCRFHVKTFGYRSGRHDKGSSHSYLRATWSTHAQSHNPVGRLDPKCFVGCLLPGGWRGCSVVCYIVGYIF